MSKISPCLWFDGEAEEAAEAMLQMTKLDIAGLKKAYDGAV